MKTIIKDDEIFLDKLQLKRNDLINYIHSRCTSQGIKINKKLINLVISHHISFFQESFKNDCTIKLKGLGSFDTKTKKAFSQRWPLNKDCLNKTHKMAKKIHIPERKMILFKASSVLKRNLNSGKEDVSYQYSNNEIAKTGGDKHEN